MPITKKVKTLVLLASVGAAGLLTACNDVEARPADSFYYQNILNLDGIVNNQMKEIYDTVVTSGDSNSETILNNILYLYSQTTFGTFYGDNNLMDAVTTNDAAALQAIADTYSVYGGDVAKVENLYYDIVYSIEEAFLGYVNTSSYQTESVFYEQDFYDAQIEAYYDLPEVDSFNVKLVDGSLRLEENTTGYNDSLVGPDAYFGDILTRYEPYISQAVLPDIYRNLLVGQYLIDQNYRSLGLSYARKVDIINLSNNSSNLYANATRDLMEAYATRVINSQFPGYDGEYLGLEFLSSLYKGTYERVYALTLSAEEKAVADAAASEIYAEANWSAKVYSGDDPLGDSQNGTYWVQSSLGAIYEDYSLLTNNRFTDDDSVRNDFTSNGAHDPEIGFQIKYNELVASSHTTSGWYTSTGLPDGTIPSALQTRLFRINVANEVDFNTDSTGAYVENMEMDYGWYRDGNYYLIPSNYESGSTTPYLVYDNGSWYIIKVDEAVKTSKLAEGNDQCYENMAKHANDLNFLDKVTRDIAGLLAENSTYTSTANQYYVEQMAISFHDDDVYNYFKSTFSTLFND